jgi:methionine salvage enolase-phosphatase E1
MILSTCAINSAEAQFISAIVKEPQAAKDVAVMTAEVVKVTARVIA